MTLVLQGSEAVSQSSDAARQFGEIHSLPKEDCSRLCIVVEELIANLYDHGGLTASDPVDLGLVRETDGVRIVIADRGKPFDPWSWPADQDPPERGGGAGLRLVRTWAQLVDYAVTAEGNRLELRMPVSR